MGQLSGSVRIRGFLALIGPGTTGASVSIKVLDITDDAITGTLVNAHPISRYNLVNEASGSVSAKVQVGGEGGFPYVGISADGED